MPNADVQDRNALMRGLAASESVVNRLALTSSPKDITLHHRADSYEVSLYFFESPCAVKDFAAALDTVVSTTVHPYRPEVERTEAHAVVQGINFRAWTETTTGRHADGRSYAQL
ncbi:hypothetical protein AB0P17_29710 [Streptomyces sp. NPDC088124]|uniref:hypothetical protein n=1 Tax=Streptomyces sp. NPDC088124 TaxID=3154654 RepID=UPI00342777C8